MKNKSLFYIFLILIIMSTCIGALNTSKNITNLTSEVIGEENHFLNDNELYDNDKMQNAESQGTYSDLIDEFNSYSGGNFELDKKIYTYDNGDSIEIKYGGIIDGKGAIIVMLGSNIRVFNVNDDMSLSFVTFRNITIVNANFDGDGSAVYFKNNGSVEYCTFINNTASNNGGAIYFNNQAHVVKSTFENNSASAGGGAIYQINARIP